MVNSDLTTIQIPKSVREDLKEIGKKGESYGDIIARLLVQYRANASH